MTYSWKQESERVAQRETKKEIIFKKIKNNTTPTPPKVPENIWREKYEDKI